MWCGFHVETTHHFWLGHNCAVFWSQFSCNTNQFLVHVNRIIRCCFCSAPPRLNLRLFAPDESSPIASFGIQELRFSDLFKFLCWVKTALDLRVNNLEPQLLQAPHLVAIFMTDVCGSHSQDSIACWDIYQLVQQVLVGFVKNKKVMFCQLSLQSIDADFKVDWDLQAFSQRLV